MLVVIGLGLYTLRLVLIALGVADYGIYSVIGGIVALFGFLNAAMTSAMQRFFSLALGCGDRQKLLKNINVAIVIHIVIAVLVLVVAQALGGVLIESYLNFPDERIESALFVYRVSVVSSVVVILQSPFLALLLSYEKMNVYAFIGVMDALMKLILAFILIGFFDNKLQAYSIGMLMVVSIVTVLIVCYCFLYFEDCRFKLIRDRKEYLEIFKFVGWNVFGNISHMLKMHGSNVLLNVFFGAIVNAAYAVTFQFQALISMFANGFSQAVNPKIYKIYSTGDSERLSNIVFFSSRFLFFLILLVVVPLFGVLDGVLGIWLESVPEYTVEFISLALVNSAIDVVSLPLITLALATGNIKRYQLLVSSVLLASLPISYVFFEYGFEPYTIFYISISVSLIALGIRLFIVCSMTDLEVRAFFREVIFNILSVLVILVPLLCIFDFYVLTRCGVKNIFVIGFLYFFISLLIIWFNGASKREKSKIKAYFWSKIG